MLWRSTPNICQITKSLSVWVCLGASQAQCVLNPSCAEEILKQYSSHLYTKVSSPGLLSFSRKILKLPPPSSKPRPHSTLSALYPCQSLLFLYRSAWAALMLETDLLSYASGWFAEVFLCIMNDKDGTLSPETLIDEELLTLWFTVENYKCKVTGIDVSWDILDVHLSDIYHLKICITFSTLIIRNVFKH